MNTNLTEELRELLVDSEYDVKPSTSLFDIVESLEKKGFYLEHIYTPNKNIKDDVEYDGIWSICVLDITTGITTHSAQSPIKEIAITNAIISTIHRNKLSFFNSK